jgi:hypothetical protein
LWIGAFQVRAHKGNGIFLADATDHVDRLRLDLSIFVLEQSHYFLQLLGVCAGSKKLRRPTSDASRRMLQETQGKARNDGFRIELFGQIEPE